MNGLWKTCHDRIMLSKDDIGPSTIVYQSNILLLLDLLNVFYMNKLDLRLILNDFELVNNPRKRKKEKKIIKNLDARLKRIMLSYDVNNIEKYLTRIAMNLKIGC